jgi:hypothetical protein
VTLGALTTLSAISACPRVVDAQSHVSYTNITGQATTVVKPGAGILHSVCFNKPVATEVVTLYDSLTATGAVIGTITVPSSPMPVCLPYNANFQLGLTIVTATASSDITVTWE